MFSEALRQVSDWGTQLVNQGMQVALDAKTVMMVVGLAVGATVWINDRVAAGDQEVSAVKSDVRVIKYEISGLQEDLAQQAKLIDSMDRRMIQYHQLVMERLEKMADRTSADVDVPPYRSGK